MTPKPLTIAEIILLIAVVIGGGWWLITVKLESSIDTSTWQTYTEERGRFTVKYPTTPKFILRPQTWFVGIEDDVNKFEAEYQGTEIFYAEGRNDCNAGSDYDPCDFSVGFSIVNNPIDVVMGSLMAIEGDLVEPITLLERRGWRWDNGDEGGGEIYHYIPYNSNATLVVIRAYTSVVWPAGKEAYKTDEKLFSDITSTFKFTK